MTENQQKQGGFYELEAARKEGANLLMPSTHIEGLSDFHAPVVETVLLSTNPDAGDAYPHDNDGKKFRLTKQALMKLSVCAGIIWSPTETKRLDNRNDRNYIAYQAVGGIKKADGAPVFFKAEYDIDFEVVEEELRELYEKKAKNLTKGRGNQERPATAQEKADYVEYCVKRDMLQKRKHGLKLAEAGAMNRVVREILGLKNAYTAAELQKPFVMVRIVFKPDYSQKDIRDKLIDAHIKAMTGIYGGEVIDKAVRESEPIDITPVQEENHENGDDDSDQPPDDSIEIQVVDFMSCDTEQQSNTLKTLAKRKGYDVSAYLKKAELESLIDLKSERRTEFFRHLLSLPNTTTTYHFKEVAYEGNTVNPREDSLCR